MPKPWPPKSAPKATSRPQTALFKRLGHRDEGKCTAIVAEYRGNVAGYVSVYPNSNWGALGGKGYPEIVDFGGARKVQKAGIGSRLMDAAEEIASQYADTVYLGVGLHSGYGSARRMYVKRGYIPDGTGVWNGNDPLKSHTDCVNVDDLALGMYKKLR